jgi:hypothetical protein
MLGSTMDLLRLWYSLPVQISTIVVGNLTLYPRLQDITGWCIGENVQVLNHGLGECVIDSSMRSYDDDVSHELKLRTVWQERKKLLMANGSLRRRRWRHIRTRTELFVE